MESRMFDFPDPFRPVIALKNGSNPGTTVLVPRKWREIDYTKLLVELNGKSLHAIEHKGGKKLFALVL
jgi:hypothetical protein